MTPTGTEDPLHRSYSIVPTTLSAKTPDMTSQTEGTQSSARHFPSSLKELIWNAPGESRRVTTQTEQYDKWVDEDWGLLDELDHEPLFLIHAELYLMASHYLINALEYMALQRLQSILITIGTPGSKSVIVSNIKSLTRYVYEEIANVEKGEEPLRRLVAIYTVLHLSSTLVMQGAVFAEIMKSTVASDREFVADFVFQLAWKLEETEEDLRVEKIRVTYEKKRPRLTNSSASN
ncbi:MAG: hypothetical protein Q9218_004187 [Villophora microphyllina]